MKVVFSYLNFDFRIEVKTKSKYRILNFVFQIIKYMKWYFEYTDSVVMNSLKLKANRLAYIAG